MLPIRTQRTTPPLVGKRGDGRQQENKAFKISMNKAHMSSQTGAACIGHTWVCTRSSEIYVMVSSLMFLSDS